MRRDGRIEPLTALAEIIGVTFLGLAAGCLLFARHRFSPIDRTAQAEAYRALTAGRTITGPSPYRPWRHP